MQSPYLKEDLNAYEIPTIASYHAAAISRGTAQLLLIGQAIPCGLMRANAVDACSASDGRHSRR